MNMITNKHKKFMTSEKKEYEYFYNDATGNLHTKTDKYINKSRLILEPISLPNNYIDKLSNLDDKIIKSFYKNVKVIKSSIDDEITNVDNNDSYFVLPSQFNGAEYPHYGSIVNDIEKYRYDNTGGPVGQLSVDLAVGQFLIDNARNSNNENGIDGTRDLLKNIKNIKCINGYLKIPEDNTEKNKILVNLNKLIIIGMKNVIVDGFYKSVNSHINIIYASAVPINRYTNPYFNKNLFCISSYIMIGEYYGALEQAYLHNKNNKQCGKIFLMPLGGGVFGNNPDDIKTNIGISLYLLEKKHTDWQEHIKVYLIAWKGRDGKSKEYELYK